MSDLPIRETLQASIAVLLRIDSFASTKMAPECAGSFCDDTRGIPGIVVSKV
jgi:hypothetical protein